MGAVRGGPPNGKSCGGGAWGEKEPVLCIRIIEVDQWSSTATQWRDKSVKFADMLAAKLTGGDSEAIRSLGIATFTVRDVRPEEAPSIGRVWFREGADGYPEYYLAHYDSSD